MRSLGLLLHYSIDLKPSLLKMMILNNKNYLIHSIWMMMMMVKNKVTSVKIKHGREETSLNLMNIMAEWKLTFLHFINQSKNVSEYTRSKYLCMAWSRDSIWCSSEVMHFSYSFLNTTVSFHSDIKCRSGEFIIDTLSSVEDTKGNNGDKGKWTNKSSGNLKMHSTGKLTITNIRLIWHSHSSARVNLCM